MELLGFRAKKWVWKGERKGLTPSLTPWKKIRKRPFSPFFSPQESKTLIKPSLFLKVEEASRRAEEALKSSKKGKTPQFLASDLESLTGKYHTGQLSSFPLSFWIIRVNFLAVFVFYAFSEIFVLFVGLWDFLVLRGFLTINRAYSCPFFL